MSCGSTPASFRLLIKRQQQFKLRATSGVDEGLYFVDHDH